MKRGEGIHVTDEQIFCSDNSSYPAEYWSNSIIQEDKIIGCVVSFININERKRSEKLQSEFTNTLAEIATFPEMNPGPVLRITVDGKILMANEAAHNILGSMPVGTFWKDICPDIDKETWSKIIKTKTVVLERHIGDHDFIFTHRRDFDSDLIFVFG